MHDPVNYRWVVDVFERYDLYVEWCRNRELPAGPFDVWADVLDSIRDNQFL